jgi:hypothetical protein
MSSPDTTPLAQGLREAAHKADVEAHNRAVIAVLGKRMSRDEKVVVVSWARSSAATVAVLRELANHADTGSQDDGMAPFELRDLADSIEKGEPDG